jgi:ArsR family transcriptional regulator, cadmium/lead-responsive transcriptional repressor
MAVPDDRDLRAILFHGFSDRSRLRILEALTDGERCVGDIVAVTGLTQPNASTHLACLWDCGLVARERRGREVYYRLTEGVADVFTAADRVLEHAGETVGACPRYGHGGRLEAA